MPWPSWLRIVALYEIRRLDSRLSRKAPIKITALSGTLADIAPASEHGEIANGAPPAVADKLRASKTLVGNKPTPPRANAPAGSGCDNTKLAGVI